MVKDAMESIYCFDFCIKAAYLEAKERLLTRLLTEILAECLAKCILSATQVYLVSVNWYSQARGRLTLDFNESQGHTLGSRLSQEHSFGPQLSPPNTDGGESLGLALRKMRVPTGRSLTRT